MMSRTVRNISLVMIILGIVGIIIGAAFLQQAYVKQAYLVNSMKEEGIKLGDLGISGADSNKIVDNAKYAQMVADKVREDRHKIAPSYEALLGGGHFDPTNAKQLSYAQALNLENYLYLAVASFGLIDIAFGTGVFMILAGISIFLCGLILFRFLAKIPVNLQ
jgi:hypothetical protein